MFIQQNGRDLYHIRIYLPLKFRYSKKKKLNSKYYFLQINHYYPYFKFIQQLSTTPCLYKNTMIP